jgi:hypothetical protein
LAGTEGDALSLLSDMTHEQGEDIAALDYGQEALRVAQMTGSRFSETVLFESPEDISS